MKQISQFLGLITTFGIALLVSQSSADAQCDNSYWGQYGLNVCGNSAINSQEPIRTPGWELPQAPSSPSHIPNGQTCTVQAISSDGRSNAWDKSNWSYVYTPNGTLPLWNSRSGIYGGQVIASVPVGETVYVTNWTKFESGSPAALTEVRLTNGGVAKGYIGASFLSNCR